MAVIPVYCCASSDPLRHAVAEALGGGVEFVDTPFRPHDLVGRPAGIVLLEVTGMSAETLVAIPGALPPPDWTVAVLSGDDPPEARAVSVAPPDALDAVAERATDPESRGGVLLELHRVLAEVARARHDINNPLTSALAETQILLLDVEDQEAREALDAVQTQIRRIRDLVAATRHIRPRK